MRRDRIDVVLVSMPFYPWLWGNYPIEYLAKAVEQRGLTVRTFHASYVFGEHLVRQGRLDLLKMLQSEPYVGDIVVLTQCGVLSVEAAATEIARQCPTTQTVTIADIRLLAQAFERTVDDTLEFVETCGTRLVGLSATHFQLTSSLALAGRIKEVSPERGIVLGGYLSCPEAAEAVLAQHPEVDVVVFGEGETTLPDIVEDWCHAPLDRRVVRGIPSRELVALPSFEAFLESGPLACGYGDYVTLPYELSRGCYWDKCDFCNFNTTYGSFRAFDYRTVMAEMEQVAHRFGVRRFNLLDTSLPPAFARTLGEDDPQHEDWRVFVEIMGHWRREPLESLRRFGVRRAQVGIESFSTSHLSAMRKGMSLLQNVAALRDCRDAAVEPVYGMLVRRPGDSAQHYRESIAAMGRLRHLPPPAYVSACEIRPGSPLFNDRREHGVEFQHERGHFDWLVEPSDFVAGLRPTRTVVPALEAADVVEALDDLEAEVAAWQHEWAAPARAAGAPRSTRRTADILSFAARPVRATRMHEQFPNSRDTVDMLLTSGDLMAEGGLLVASGRTPAAPDLDGARRG